MIELSVELFDVRLMDKIASFPAVPVLSSLTSYVGAARFLFCEFLFVPLYIYSSLAGYGRNNPKIFGMDARFHNPEIDEISHYKRHYARPMIYNAYLCSNEVVRKIICIVITQSCRKFTEIRLDLLD